MVEQLEQFTFVSAVLMAIVEKLCEFILQGLLLVGVKDVKPEAKAMAVAILTVVGCFLLQINVFPLLGVTFVLPWLGTLFTGLLVGTGADILHIAKERLLAPKVKA